MQSYNPNLNTNQNRTPEKVDHQQLLDKYKKFFDFYKQVCQIAKTLPSNQTYSGIQKYKYINFQEPDMALSFQQAYCELQSMLKHESDYLNNIKFRLDHKIMKAPRSVDVGPLMELQKKLNYYQQKFLNENEQIQKGIAMGFEDGKLLTTVVENADFGGAFTALNDLSKIYKEVNPWVEANPPVQKNQPLPTGSEIKHEKEQTALLREVGHLENRVEKINNRLKEIESEIKLLKKKKCKNQTEVFSTEHTLKRLASEQSQLDASIKKLTLIEAKREHLLMENYKALYSGELTQIIKDLPSIYKNIDDYFTKQNEMSDDEKKTLQQLNILIVEAQAILGSDEDRNKLNDAPLYLKYNFLKQLEIKLDSAKNCVNLLKNQDADEKTRKEQMAKVANTVKELTTAIQKARGNLSELYQKVKLGHFLHNHDALKVYYLNCIANELHLYINQNSSYKKIGPYQQVQFSEGTAYAESIKAAERHQQVIALGPVCTQLCDDILTSAKKIIIDMDDQIAALFKQFKKIPAKLPSSLKSEQEMIDIDINALLKNPIIKFPCLSYLARLSRQDELSAMILPAAVESLISTKAGFDVFSQILPGFNQNLALCLEQIKQLNVVFKTIQDLNARVDSLVSSYQLQLVKKSKNVQRIKQKIQQHMDIQRSCYKPLLQVLGGEVLKKGESFPNIILIIDIEAYQAKLEKRLTEEEGRSNEAIQFIDKRLHSLREQLTALKTTLNEKMGEVTECGASDTFLNGIRSKQNKIDKLLSSSRDHLYGPLAVEELAAFYDTYPNIKTYLVAIMCDNISIADDLLKNQKNLLDKIDNEMIRLKTKKSKEEQHLARKAKKAAEYETKLPANENNNELEGFELNETVSQRRFTLFTGQRNQGPQIQQLRQSIAENLSKPKLFQQTRKTSIAKPSSEGEEEKLSPYSSEEENSFSRFDIEDPEEFSKNSFLNKVTRKN